MQATFASNVMGTVVLTDYNNNTYRIEDVDFNTTPTSTFPMRDGSMISYTEYYQKKYGIRIKNSTQPMLLTRNKPRDRQADKGDLVYLVPELCRATGSYVIQLCIFQIRLLYIVLEIQLDRSSLLMPSKV